MISSSINIKIFGKWLYCLVFFTSLNLFPTYIDMANEEFVQTMTVAINLRNFIIRLIREAEQEAGIVNKEAMLKDGSDPLWHCY